MDRTTVFTKTAKGITQVNQKSASLSKDLMKVLKLIDGKSNFGQLMDKAGLDKPSLEKALNTLTKDGFSRVFQENNLFVVLSATGLFVQFGLQAVINMASSLHLMPTKGMTLPSLLTAEPDEVAEAIFRAVAVKPRDIIYIKPIWLIIMTIIKAIPEPVFKRLRI